MPTLEQKGRVEFPLLTAQLFDMVGAELMRAQRFEGLAFTVSLLVGARCLLAQAFETPDFLFKLQTKPLQLLAEQAGKLEFGGGASGGKRSGVGEFGLDEKAVKLGERVLRSGEIEGSLLQGQRALAFEASAKP